MAKFDAQIARMMELANYGLVSENTHKKTNVNKGNFEYQMMGADGKSYAIVRENAYYYIKSADADKQNLAEAYDYLGGYMNRKNYEYKSYDKALKNFELKMRSLNEAFEGNEAINVLNPDAKAAILEERSSDMRRMIEIMNNAALIAEGKEIGASRKNDTVMFDGANPEAETGKKGCEDYKAAEKPQENKDFKKKANQASKEDGDTYTEKPVKGKDQLEEECCGSCEAENGTVSPCMDKWGQKDKGGAVMTCDQADMQEPHLNEDENTFAAGLPGQAGTGEADTDHNDAPFDDNVNEGCCGKVDECGNGLNPMCEEDEEIEDDEPEIMDDAQEDGDEFEPEIDLDDEGEDEMPAEDDEEMPEEEPVDDEEMPEEEPVEDEEEVDENDPDSIRAEIERLQGLLDDMEGEDEAPEEEPAEDDEEMPAEEDEEEPEAEEEAAPEDFQEDDEDLMLGEEPMCEAKQRYMNGIVNAVVESILKEEKTTLHDFGKHPGYRKKPMTLPATGADKNEHGEDWNDDSVHNEQPFGQKIGSSAPYDKLVNMITDAVVNELKKK